MILTRIHTFREVRWFPTGNVLKKDFRLQAELCFMFLQGEESEHIFCFLHCSFQSHDISNRPRLIYLYTYGCSN